MPAICLGLPFCRIEGHNHGPAADGCSKTLFRSFIPLDARMCGKPVIAGSDKCAEHSQSEKGD